MEKLKNKKFLITGATGYLGRVISEQIVNEGANVILLSNNFKKLKLVKKSLEKKYDSHIDIIKGILVLLSLLAQSITKGVPSIFFKTLLGSLLELTLACRIIKDFTN